MYNIRQFKPALYLLLFLGMIAFALAAQSWGVFVIGGGGVVLNGWLVRTGRFRPLPRLWANLLTIAALFVVGRQLFTPTASVAVLVIGQFLIALQLVKLWEQRANRDYAQLLVLSLLQMVAAAISTVSLVYGVLLVVYLFLSLYCCLLFHLKVETDAARAAMPLPKEKFPEMALRQDQRYLARSMRRLTGVVSCAAIVMAIAVFISFPRGAGQNMLTPMQFSQTIHSTGYSDEVDLDQFTKLSQDESMVGRVEVWRNDHKIKGTRSFFLRGTLKDKYEISANGGRWLRDEHNPRSLLLAREDSAALFPDARNVDTPWRLHLMLDPTRERALFTIAGPALVTPRRDLRVQVDTDGVLRSEQSLNQPFEYDVAATGRAADAWPDKSVPEVPEKIRDAILREALKPEVSGSDDSGPLGERRYKHALEARRMTGGKVWLEPDPMDGSIANAIRQYLQGNGFRYTTDLTDANRPAYQDPFEWFLSPDGRRGHCQYYAGSMVLLCQSLGIKARFVQGYRVDAEDFNDIPGADYYIIKESNAHAWVEVLTTDGWIEFDPTNSRDISHPGESAGFWTHVKHIVDVIEYSYATNVIGYGNDNRDSLIQKVEAQMTAPLYKGINNDMFTRGRRSAMFKQVTQSLPSAAATAAGLLIAAGVAWFAIQRWRLRRRAARIGIDSLPAAERERLARQLGFYDELVRLLGRHKIARPAHMTPREFSRSLMYLPSDAYRTIARLTALFYQVRFGGTELSPARHRHLGNAVSELDAMLGSSLSARR